jgi:hypothetical protein
MVTLKMISEKISAWRALSQLGLAWLEIAFDSARISFTWPRVLSER